MSKYFSTKGATSLLDVPKGSKIHVIGVCGVAMAPLAILLSEAGYRVSGSDKEFYEPMASLLKNSSVDIKDGYSADNIIDGIALVVIGNSASANQVEVVEVEKKLIPYTLFPKLLYDLLIKGKKSIVVTGTHGKTTTTALGISALKSAEANPSYFVGGAIKDNSPSLVTSDGKVSIVEGDEYDSAFFAKVPKFSFYKPNVLIITSIEYDHADIYTSLEAIEKEFTNLVVSLSDNDHCVCCIDDQNVNKLLPQWRREAKCKFVTYGKALQADVIVGCEQLGSVQKVRFESKKFGEGEYSLNLTGSYNALNATAIYISTQLLNFNPKKILSGISSFQGVKRRQDIIIDSDQITLIEDFAHHPTAVKETIKGIKERYPDRRLIAVFEPRSNTSRRLIFKESYIHAFMGSNLVILGEVKRRDIDQDLPLLEVSDLVAGINDKGVPCKSFPDSEGIAKYLEANVVKGDVVLIMSNGGFGGLVVKLNNYFSKLHQI